MNKKTYVKDILNHLDEIAKFNIQESWDNSGLLIGSKEKEVNNILICLDLTEEILKEAIEEKVNLIITHHPVIFNPIKIIDANDLVYKVIKSEISVISIHTNIDIAKDGINDQLANLFNLNNIKPLSITEENQTIGVVGEIKETNYEEFLNTIKTKLNISTLKVSNKSISTVKKVAICGGTGGHLINDVIKKKADVYITADLKQNHYVDNDIILIDAGHHHTEIIGMYYLKNVLEKELNNIKITLIDKSPYIFK